MRFDDHRLNQVFRCVVEQYIETATPIGSRLVSKMYDGHLSSATIRNVMADLEEIGLINQPYTSAGRVPTEKGYRYYVNCLMPQENDAGDVRMPDLEKELDSVSNIEDVAERVLHILADLTQNASLLLMKNVRRISYFETRVQTDDAMIQGDSESGDRLYMDGASHMLEQPEFRDLSRIAAVLRAFELKDKLMQFLEQRLNERRLSIHIGSEVGCPDLEGVSAVVREYCLEDQPVGCLGVIGPTRMRYDRTAGIVERMAGAVTEYLNSR